MLQKELSPRSSFHLPQNNELFKEKIRQFEQLASDLPQATSSEWQFDFTMAMQGLNGMAVTQEGRRKAQKPQLNTEDLDSMYY